MGFNPAFKGLILKLLTALNVFGYVFVCSLCSVFFLHNQVCILLLHLKLHEKYV